jgi:cyclic beta-1,2-glucan synthetase
VADPSGEALYLRDEASGRIWTPTPKPAGARVPYQIRHGAGYSEWRNHSQGLSQLLRIFVPPDAPVKLVQLRLHNTSERVRRITATYYAEWVLGCSRRTTQPFVVTEYDPEARALLAQCSWNADFAERTAFLTSSHPPHGFTCDRAEFLGREGDPSHPAALERWGMSDRTDPGSDPCAAFQIHLDIEPNTDVNVLFALGQGRDREQALSLARHWSDPKNVEAAWVELGEHWERLLGAVRVETPEPAFDLMLNRWLLYQAVSSRLFARTGFYQSSGALGFRDQLQDMLALVHADPARVRRHLLGCAAAQFEEGDVLHWWHPPRNRGVRTRCSDDLLWLPFATAHYVRATGDLSVLDEEVPFLQAAPLDEKERDRFAHFQAGAETASLFEHCERALERGVTSGPHGLPLIGDGDWNDGMNRVGERGQGESIWLAWFAVAVMKNFAELCQTRGDIGLGRSWHRRADHLTRTVERAGWDGDWYLRAIDDEGRAWGSRESEECNIDSISQSWAVLSGAASSERAECALRSAERKLVREEEKLVRLLWPPFDVTPRNPGYIKAYPPGVRENGGQYTHAATWLAWGFAAHGDGDQAARIFRFINPISHTATREDAQQYRVEPYVIAADIASAPPHTGRGGWTWYTGSAAWAWRVGIEAILGLTRTGDSLQLDPRIPMHWGRCRARLRFDGGTLDIRIEDPHGVGSGVSELRLDDEVIEGAAVVLPDDGEEHAVLVRLGKPDRLEELPT